MKVKQPSLRHFETEGSVIASDFPAPEHVGLISGTKPKLLLCQHGDKFYSPGSSQHERYERWRRCEVIAEHLCVKSLESKAGKRSHMSELEILEQYLVRLSATGWVSAAEARWTIRRSAALLGGWPVPHEAQAPSEGVT